MLPRPAFVWVPGSEVKFCGDGDTTLPATPTAVMSSSGPGAYFSWQSRSHTLQSIQTEEKLFLLT